MLLIPFMTFLFTLTENKQVFQYLLSIKLTYSRTLSLSLNCLLRWKISKSESEILLIFRLIFADLTRFVPPTEAKPGLTWSRRSSPSSHSTPVCCCPDSPSNVTWSSTSPPPATASPCSSRRCPWRAPACQAAAMTTSSLVEIFCLSPLTSGQSRPLMTNYLIELTP